MRDWQDSDGNKRIYFTGSKKESGRFAPAYGDDDAPPDYSGDFSGPIGDSDFADLSDDDDELPL